MWGGVGQCVVAGRGRLRVNAIHGHCHSRYHNPLSNLAVTQRATAFGSNSRLISAAVVAARSAVSSGSNLAIESTTGSVNFRLRQHRDRPCRRSAENYNEIPPSHEHLPR
jgi:hypothetical protein